ncbi:MAG TPA: hypothetical protein VFK20_02810 [Vicinamibacterales bacterium]|nr:hypothetical protein [Vicinamibacterales bacterium]
MNVYRSLGYAAGTPEALELAERLSAWHDAMVAHERRARSAGGSRCDDECPHADARPLWRDALQTFGADARQLAFLRSRGQGGRATRAARPRESRA